METYNTKYYGVYVVKINGSYFFQTDNGLEDYIGDQYPSEELIENYVATI
jgi:hypothetical protein